MAENDIRMVFRRAYLAVGASIEGNGDRCLWQYQIDYFHVLIQIGYKPFYPIGIHENKVYITDDMQSVEIKLHSELSDTPYSGSLIIDVVIGRDFVDSPENRKHYDPLLVKYCDFASAFLAFKIKKSVFKYHL